ncbi:MAG: gamma carbonic anhydrase family protein [Flavobacteriaceae bacterium]|nr:gamma carbonic anhydrase family protein [Flavobacteriaceae bacterium]
MLIKSVRGYTPVVPESCFIAENASLIGRLSMGEDCSIWFNAVLRADVNFIKLGRAVNVQDNAVIHCTFEKSPTKIGDFVSIGHNAIVHGCTVEDKVLIGMGSVVMDDCVVETKSIIAAGAVLTKGTRVTAGSIYAGIPAKKIGEVSADLQKNEIERIANNYKTYSSWFKEGYD